MRMTLEQLLFQVREALYDAKRYGAGDWSYLTDAIAAYLTQPAQSVDEICDGCGSNVLITKCCECGNETYVNPQNTTAAIQEKGKCCVCDGPNTYDPESHVCLKCQDC